MTDTEDPRGDAVTKLHGELDGLRGVAVHRGDTATRIAAIHAAATLELVEAVRDLTSLVALAVAPSYPDAPIVDEGDAEPADEADAGERPTTVGDLARYLGPGDVLRLESGETLTVTATGSSEGSAWLELHDGTEARRVWVDALAGDERVVLADAESEAPAESDDDLVTSTPRVDADAEGAEWPDDEDDEADA